MTLRRAMAKSVNSITAFMTKKLSPNTVVDYAKKLGIQSKLDAVPAVCLGAGGDVSLFDLVGAYSTFINKGIWMSHFLSRIEDKYGNLIQEFIPTKQEALSEETAYLMLHMLKGSKEEEGGLLGLNPELTVDNDVGAKPARHRTHPTDGLLVLLTTLYLGRGLAVTTEAYISEIGSLVKVHVLQCLSGNNTCSMFMKMSI